MTTGLRKPGEFCWTNMLTPQPEQAHAFFAELFGWTYFEIPGLGHGVRVGGSDVGAIFDVEAPNTPPGTKPHIGVLMRVENVDAICEQVTSLGGKTKPAFDINDQGRMAVCTDPNGAEFDVWEPKKFFGTDVDSTLHGAPSWFETLTTDTDRATAFYTALFGWTPEVSRAPGLEYTTFKLGTDPVAGLMGIRPEMGPLRPHWGTYYTVTDADETARQSVSLGASLCVPVRDIPGVGRFCGIISPHGVMFYAIQYTS
jgi:uncharacterized protein